MQYTFLCDILTKFFFEGISKSFLCEEVFGLSPKYYEIVQYFNWCHGYLKNRYCYIFGQK